MKDLFCTQDVETTAGSKILKGFKPPYESTVTAHSKLESKISQVVKLLKRKQGATLNEMIKATRWQKHTTRAALTGLKKKGYTIERDKRGDVTCYRVTASA